MFIKQCLLLLDDVSQTVILAAVDEAHQRLSSLLQVLELVTLRHVDGGTWSSDVNKQTVSNNQAHTKFPLIYNLNRSALSRDS